MEHSIVTGLLVGCREIVVIQCSSINLLAKSQDSRVVLLASQSYAFSVCGQHAVLGTIFGLMDQPSLFEFQAPRLSVIDTILSLSSLQLTVAEKSIYNESGGGTELEAKSLIDSS